jgi:hypothetical protein
MPKKGLRRTLIILAIVAFGFLALSECMPGKPTWFNFRRIDLGMVQSDVEAILGPGAPLHDGKKGNERLIVPGQAPADVDMTLRWEAKDFTRSYLLLGFKDGRVRFKYQSSFGS